MRTSDRKDSDAPHGPAVDGRRARKFRAMVLKFYAEHGRSFPWRETRDPWAILVSEIMLQQTQTERVVPKYLAWMRAFPNPQSLAESPLSRVMELWSGLGYNRRALALREAASKIVELGAVPDDVKSLTELPGVGPYTAGAVCAFAFNRPTLFIETNIRSVYLHYFFPDEVRVPDSRIMPVLEATMDKNDPRTWYYALMDLGVKLKKTLGNPNTRSAHYSKQSSFADSNRRIRGALLREIGGRAAVAADDLAAALPFSRERVEAALAQLVAEGFVAERGGVYRLAD